MSTAPFDPRLHHARKGGGCGWRVQVTDPRCEVPRIASVWAFPTSEHRLHVAVCAEHDIAVQARPELIAKYQLVRMSVDEWRIFAKIHYGVMQCPCRACHD